MRKSLIKLLGTILFVLFIAGGQINDSLAGDRARGVATGVGQDDKGKCTTTSETHYYLDGVFPYVHSITVTKTVCESAF